MEQEISLPSRASGWKWDEKEIKYNFKTLLEYIDGAAELYLAYSFQNLTVRRFEKSNQPPIIVELYEMSLMTFRYVLTSDRKTQETPVQFSVDYL